MPSLSEKVVLITGASSGIGAALAQLLAQRFMGIRLVLAARNVEKLEENATLTPPRWGRSLGSTHKLREN